MRARGIFFIVLAGMVISSCAAFTSIHYGKEYAPPTDKAQIRVLTQKPGDEYTELGEVTVFGVTDSNRAYMLRRLREMAAEMGGDALILQEREFPRYTPKPLRGIVIKWKKGD